MREQYERLSIIEGYLRCGFRGIDVLKESSVSIMLLLLDSGAEFHQ